MSVSSLSSILAVSLAVSLAASGPSAQHLAKPGSDKIHSQMIRLLDERGPSKAWVFFRDKGLSDRRARNDALLQAEAELNARTRARRAARRSKPGLVDFHDLPVNASYVDRAVASGAELVSTTKWLNAISVNASREQLERIARLPFVDRIEPVRRGKLIDRPDETDPRPKARALGASQPDYSNPYGASRAQLRELGLLRVHAAGYNGTGVRIGILDTGFHRGHEAFNEPGYEINVIAEYDFVNDDPNTGIEAGDDPSQHNHGTWILGTLASYLPNQLIGAAYGADYILCKTEDTTDEYQAEEDFYVCGLEFIESNGGDVVTSSLGYIDWYTQADLDGLTATTTIGVNIATSNGIFCCTAAGNSGNDTDPSTSSLIAPADAFEVITCGAVDPSGVIAYFSSDGPSADGRTKPELLARGYPTWTVCATLDVQCLTILNGTSLSTPLIAGSVACLAQANPGWSIAQMRRRLFASGDYFRANGTNDPEFVLGYGIPNAFMAGLIKGLHGTKQ